jgi:hypothetical protein
MRNLRIIFYTPIFSSKNFNFMVVIKPQYGYLATTIGKDCHYLGCNTYETPTSRALVGIGIRQLLVLRTAHTSKVPEVRILVCGRSGHFVSLVI